MRRPWRQIGGPADVVAIAGVLALVAAPVVAVLCALVVHGPVTARSVSVSLERQLGNERVYDSGYGCRRAGTSWRCAVPDGDSGIAAYAVAVRRGSSCWDARLTTRGESAVGMPPTVSGCAHRWPGVEAALDTIL